MSTAHEWGYVSFNFASWTECSCGFRPQSQEEFDAHSQAMNHTVGGPA
jgi:hypothetical protein